MIDRYKLLEKRFSNVHNHLELVAIENIAIPLTKIEVEVIGLQVDDILPTTEFILRFVDLGIDTVELLSEALGFDTLLVENLLVSEEKSGNLRLFPQTNSVKLTMQGRETLTTKLATAPKVTTKQVLFDNCFWKISSWNLRDFSHRAALDKAQIEYMSLAKMKKSRILQTDLDLVHLNRELLRQSKKLNFEAHQILKIVARKSGYKLAKIMIFHSDNVGSDFVIVIDDERSIEFENYLKSKGGLESLGIDFEKVESEEKVLAMKVAELPNEILENSEDGGPILPYEHPHWLESALENSKKRLLIISPWVHERVVNQRFISQLERLLQNKVKVVIAWGFGTDREEETKKSSTVPLRNLMRLANKYRDYFTFIKMHESHAKILISDDIYIATSFNWLSFMGSKRKKYRTEFGEMRNVPKIVDSRFQLMLEECNQHGEPMSEKFIV